MCMYHLLCGAYIIAFYVYTGDLCRVVLTKWVSSVDTLRRSENNLRIYRII